jgi:hypothetical protein
VLVLPLLYGVAFWRNRGRPFFNLRGAIATAVVMGAGASLLIALTYAPEVRALVLPSSSGNVARVVPVMPPEMTPEDIAAVVEPGTGLFAFGYFRGLRELLQLDAEGYPSYLLGDFRRHGWWYYFPVAFLVKTPTGVLAACAIAAFSLWRGRREPPPLLLSLCLVLPPLVYFAMAMRSSINIGVRHILPVFPFLYVLLAFALIHYGPLLLRAAWRWALVAVIALVSLESLSAYPHYLSFFNWTSGGPANGSRYLLDSNIDWGQDLKNLATFVKANHLTPLCTALFGPAPARYYGIEARNLNQTGTPEGVENLPCVVAISANPLRGLYNAPKKYQPLPQRQPLARIGYSVYIYDLRRPK